MAGRQTGVLSRNRARRRSLNRTILRDSRAVGSWGGRRPSLGGYVTGTEATRGGPPPEGVDVGYPLLGVVGAGGGLGGAIGPYLAGWLFDVTSSYRLAFLAACVAVAGSAVAAWIAARPTAGAPTRPETGA